MTKHYRDNVRVYNETILVDTKTGEGIDKILKKIDPLLCKFASKYFVNNYSFEDLKQELAAIAIEGIYAYDATKGTKLSTFLQTHLTNKMISKIKSQNKMAKDAFAYDGDNSDESGYSKARDEIHFSQFNALLNRGNGGENIRFENNINQDDNIFENIKKDYRTVEFEISLQKVISRLNRVDRDTSRILELIYYKDYSLSDAARAVGLTHWAVTSKLKKLQNKQYIKEIFNKA